MADPVTVGSVVATWKLLGSLVNKYQDWSVRKKTSARAKELMAKAESLMNQINKSILGGASSDDPKVVPLVREFRQLLAQEVRPMGYEHTVDWIGKSAGRPVRRPAAKKAAKRPAAKKMSAAKRAAAKKRAPAKKAAAKKAAKRA